MLDRAKIAYVMYHTKGYLDAFKYIKDLDLQAFSAVIAVGGDGTIHEVVNGMMFRADRSKIPLAFVPNGSGNDTCFSLGMLSVEQALQCIEKGEILKVDLNRVLLDAQTEQDAAGDISRLRYSVINSCPGFVARVVHRALNYKSWAGRFSYLLAALAEFFVGGPAESFKVTVTNKCTFEGGV